MDDDLKKAMGNVKVLQRSIRVTKVVCTRSIKGKSGDHYVGYSVAWNSHQDDAAGAADLISAQSHEEVQEAAQQGWSVEDARLVAHLVAMEVDLLAHDHAVAGSTITPEQRVEAKKAIRHNFSELLVEKVTKGLKAE